MPDDVEPAHLDASARRELRALGRANAENVARHLVMVQRLLDSDPELAYRHARYAASHAGRIAVVRESAGIAAYLSEHYNEALRDIRAARRLSGLDMHRAIEADCERALGRHQQALRIAKEATSGGLLDDQEEAELAMVVSGIRHEMGHSDVGLAVVEQAILMFRGDRETLRRLHSVRADRLEELGRTEEAQAVRERIGEAPEEDVEVEVEVYDIEDDYAAEQAALAAAEDTDADDDDAEAYDDVESGHREDAEDAEDASDPEDGAESGGEDTPPAGHDGGDSQTDPVTPPREEDFAARVEAEMAELLGEADEPHGA